MQHKRTTTLWTSRREFHNKGVEDWECRLRQAFKNTLIDHFFGFQVPDENEAANYVKVVIPKDEETQKQLKNTMCKNVLFSHLDIDEQKSIFDAMFPVEKKAGETIIEQVNICWHQLS